MANTIRRIRDVKMKAQGGLCYYCERPMWVADPDAFRHAFNVSPGLANLLRCTAEHLTPRSNGGRNGGDNIVAACWFCNQTRHRARRPRRPDAYRVLVQSRIASGRWLQIGKMKLPSPLSETAKGRLPRA